MNNKELTDQVFNQELKGLQKIADDAYDVLVAKKQNPRLPEDVFKHHFLEYFTGHGEPQPERNVLAEWVGIAGSVSNHVDVFDRNSNEVLFTVPPIMDTSNMKVAASKGKSLSELNIEHSIAKHSFPGAGLKFAQTTMVDKAKNIAGEHPDMTKSEQQWQHIHQRYYGDKALENKTSTTNVDTGDLYEFD